MYRGGAPRLSPGQDRPYPPGGQQIYPPLRQEHGPYGPMPGYPEQAQHGQTYGPGTQYGPDGLPVYMPASPGSVGRQQQAQARPLRTFRALSDQVRGVVTAHSVDELTGRRYTAESAQELATSLAERCMLHLRDISGGDFKIIVSASILQRAGAGLHSVSTCYWDSAHDATVTVRMEFPEMISIVNVYGLRID